MSNVYMIQPAFTTGEISPYVGNRSDIDKYKSALLNAQNTTIRAYGGCYRRQGSKYIGEMKYSDRDAILVEFSVSANDAYLLEVGYQYIRIWHEDSYIGTELVTPFTDVSVLQFTQSADTMFICSGTYPVKQLSRTATGWLFKDFEITESYYDSLVSAYVEGRSFTVPGSYTFIPSATGKYKIEISGAGGGGGGMAYKYYTDSGTTYSIAAAGGSGGNGELVNLELTLTAGTAYSVGVGSGGGGGTTSVINGTDAVSAGNGSSGVASEFAGHIANAGTGGTGGSITAGKIDTAVKTAGTNGTSYTGGSNGGSGGNVYGTNPVNGLSGNNGYVRINYEDNNTITPSAISGDNVILTAIKDTFTAGMVGGYIKLSQIMPNKTVSVILYEQYATVYTESIYVGQTWKIITHGTWQGEVVIEKSDDGITWDSFRKYTAHDDNNYTESGTVTDGCWMRAIVTMINDDSSDDSRLSVDLSRLPYVHDGNARITAISSTTQAVVSVIDDFGNTNATNDYSFSSWNSDFGYPSLACFFQDRLCLAATKQEPYAIWLSRTGDYPNFSVEKVDGSVTDDSAIKLDLIVRNGYKILHMIPSQDLVVLTSGDEFVISGDSIITPTKAFPKPQTMRGSSSCMPQHIGNRIVHVQRSGSTVSDLGYQYESDNYNGIDLTILATHLFKNHTLISSAYCQEPDSVLYYVREDGVLLALTIIREQNVYAWSHMVTDGLYKWIESIPDGNNDNLYAIVQRTVNGSQKRYIECFEPMTDDADAYVDSYVIGSGNSISLPHLIGKTVQLVGDGKRLDDVIVPSTGVIALQETYTRIIAGLSYTTKIEQPGAEINLNEGTLQARIHRIDSLVMRVEKSYGGRVGYTFDRMDEIEYPEWCSLYDGDLLQSVPQMDIGSNTKNHVCILHNEPYPFKLNAIIKEVSIDGGFVKSFNGNV